MADSSSWGVLAPYKTAPLPPLPSVLKALGPGVIFMALAQGSGELIWWPYIIAMYGLSFLFLLLPRLLASVSCDLRNWPLYSAHWRKYLSGIHSTSASLRLLLLDFNDLVLSLVRRVRCGWRHFARSVDELSRRLVAARANALLGLCVDVGIPRSDFAEQGYLPAG